MLDAFGGTQVNGASWRPKESASPDESGLTQQAGPSRVGQAFTRGTPATQVAGAQTSQPAGGLTQQRRRIIYQQLVIILNEDISAAEAETDPAANTSDKSNDKASE